MATPEWQALVDDGDNVFDMSWLEGMSAQVVEHPMIEGPSSPYKVVWIVRFKEGMDRAEASAYWRNTHGPIFKGLDIDRYVQNHALRSLWAAAARPGTRSASTASRSAGSSDEAQFLRAWIQRPGRRRSRTARTSST